MAIVDSHISRAEAARTLRVSPRLLDKLAAKNGIRTFQVPGHNRRWFDRKDVEKLAAVAAGQEARA
jgi:DNA-binding transcriptional MerR regulator